MNRHEEVRKLLSMSPEEMVEKAKGRLVILDDLNLNKARIVKIVNCRHLGRYSIIN